MAKSNVTWLPKWVPLSILDFARIIHGFGEDKDALTQWVKQFADDLLFCNVDTNDDFTRELLSIANEKYTSRAAICKKAGKASAKARKQRQQQQNLGSGKPSTTISTNDNGGGAERGDASDGDITGKSQDTARTTASSDEFGSAKPDNASGPRGDNTANDASGIGPEPDSHLNGDALSSDASDGCFTRESADPARTTIPEQFEALDTPKTGDSNTGMQQPSCSPEDGDNLNWHEIVQQSLGTAEGYDQETEARESQTGAGAPPVRDPDCHNAPAPRFPRKSRPPKNAEEVRYFAADHALDVEDARDWYEMNYVERPGCDKNGVAIENWKGHCTAYCQTMAERRKAG